MTKYHDSIMFLLNCHVCFLILSYASVSCANRKPAMETIRITVTPKRLRVFEMPVRLNIFHLSTDQRQTRRNISRLVNIKILNQNKEVGIFHKSFRSFNQTTLEVPCEIFSSPGKYHLQYFVQGITKTFKQMRQKIVVREEKIRIEAPKNHTAVSGSVTVWITSKHKRCKPYNGTVQVFWINRANDHVLVSTRKIVQVDIEKRTQLKFRCNIFDTEGIFYFKYTSHYRNIMLAKSDNMLVTWGKYKLETLSKNIFPCSTTLPIKFTSPYCDGAEDKVEIRTKDFNNVIDSQSAYPGFNSVFFTCATFKKHILDYCFHYITKSSLTKTEKIQAKLCLPSVEKEVVTAEWSQWTKWGHCSSHNDCGQGRKLRLRFCTATRVLQNMPEIKMHCDGPYAESTACTISPCKNTNCQSCNCGFTKPSDTIIFPESLSLAAVKNKSSCHWWIKIDPNKKVKLWFDTMNLATNSAVDIIDGNDSNSQILKRITKGNQKIIGDIIGSSNVISIKYYFNGNLNGNNSGFQLSYSSIDKSTSPLESKHSQSNTKRLAKMIFIGILVLMVLIMAGILFAVFFKMRRQRREQRTKTSLSHTSTACMSESTVRSFYEPQASGDEHVNNNQSFSRVNSNYRPRVSAPVRIDNGRSSVHVCPKCCDSIESCPSELYLDANHTTEGKLRLYNDSYYEPVIESSYVEQEKRHGYSAPNKLPVRTSSSSEEARRRHFPTYL